MIRLVAIALFAASASAQVPMQPGTLVRLVKIERYDVRRQGYVITPGSDSVVVRFAPVPEWELRGEVLTVPVQRLEVRTAIKRRTKPGAFIGALTGMASGVIVAHRAIGNICDGGNPFYGNQTCSRDTSADAALFIAGGLLGAGTGAAIGWLAKSETWRPAAGSR